MPHGKSFKNNKNLIAEVVEFGRHVRLRGVWGDPWGFESPLRHQTYLNKVIS